MRTKKGSAMRFTRLLVLPLILLGVGFGSVGPCPAQNANVIPIDGWSRARIEKELGRRLTAQDSNNLREPASIHYIYTDVKTGRKEIGYGLAGGGTPTSKTTSPVPPVANPPILVTPPPVVVPVTVPVPVPVPVPQMPPGLPPTNPPVPTPTTSRAPISAPAPVSSGSSDRDDSSAATIREQIRALAEQDDAVREAAKKQLVEIGQPAIPALTDAVKNGKKPARLAAAQVLESMGPSAKGAILALGTVVKKDEDEEVRAAAQKALQAIDRK
jgi:hypothetical protein